ncbi:MAG: class I SAM-dependent rRNA methyltransferase [Proteobacteria bacterium]|nr:class I SAM-dependent rRNA methyltransferase [Pseudomonadota bacterium]
MNTLVHLKKNIKSRILKGHPWVYDNEIECVAGSPEAGEIVSLHWGTTFIGKGYYNPHSRIRVRILTRKDETLNKSFFAVKIAKALVYRKNIFSASETSFRVIFGEADGLPGLIVDKFSDYLVMQITTLGMHVFRSDIISVLADIFQPQGIYAKDNEKSAHQEGFPPAVGWVYGLGPEIIPFAMNGICFLADTRGQKTGFFLDQRLNAAAVRFYAENKTVLDAFAYTGNFGIHALYGNAQHVTFIDCSQRALDVLEETLVLNRFDRGRYELILADTFDYLRKLDKAQLLFDFTIIDPPSLAKARDTKQQAIKGYRELNLRAMKITRPGGLLSTSSCTQIIYEEDFKKIVYSAAENTGRLITVLHKGMQSPDHPVVLNILETEYLKYYLLKVEAIKGD